MALHMESVVDRIYEAALVPESWPSVIHDMAALAGSASGSLAMHGPAYGVQLLGAGATTDHINEAPGAWISSHGLRIARTRAQPLAGFVRMADLLSDQEIQADPAQRALLTLGLDAQSAAHIMLPSGESACFTFERSHGEGLHAPNQINTLNGLRPHLARAVLIATRTGLQRAQTMVVGLEMIGLAAAALSRDGRVLAINPAFDSVSLLRPAAFGRLSIESPTLDALYQRALIQAQDGSDPVVRSIPLPLDGAATPRALHVVPIRGAANDVFTRTACLLIVTTFGVTTAAPDLTLLHGLFDLTPREASLAAALATGRTLQQAAAANGMRYSTARTHLEHIFSKTGTRQQTQLVLLLQGARSIGTVG